jgi:hypothetical protein
MDCSSWIWAEYSEDGNPHHNHRMNPEQNEQGTALLLSLSCEEATICNNGIVIISKASLSLY